MTILEEAQAVAQSYASESTSASTSIRFIGYIAVTTQVAIGFKEDENHLYLYSDFSSSQLEEFLAAPSRGQWWGQHLRNNPRHPFTKVGLQGYIS